MARHFGCAVIPARMRKARDKAKVEVGVQVVEQWILARLRKKTFFSLSELNAEIRRLLEHLNDKPFQKLPGCRRSAFEALDRPALKPLPTEPYEYAEWKKVRVNIDYHVEVDRHYYSVPYQLVSHQLDARFTRSTVELLHKGRRVTSHVRSYKQGGYTTLAEHMPTAHRQWADWTPERLVRWAAKSGPATAQVVECPNQVWTADITYIPMRRGFMYLVAVMDWHSRKTLAWRLSNTLDSAFCVEALQEAIDRHGIPEIFNTDQGAQFTSQAFTGELQAHQIQISMDGRGRVQDNIFIERLWWTLKYQYLYQWSFDNGRELRVGLDQWFDFYNCERPHQALDNQTPDEVYYGSPHPKQEAA